MLTLSCVERAGIVQAVTTFLFERGFNIDEHQQFDDGLRETLHLRTAFSGSPEYTPERLQEEFSAIADRFEMKFSFHDQTKQRVLVMVSKFGHCLNDLIFRWRGGSLGGDIVLVVSNHEDPPGHGGGRRPAVPPCSGDARDQGRRRSSACWTSSTNTTSTSWCWPATCRCCPTTCAAPLRAAPSTSTIPSCPASRAPRPYHQAYDRGVKLVGATAHYVTADLDEGPIIEQEVIRVDHSYGPTALSTVGRDAEALALSRAVRWHCEHRVLLDQTSTVVFR